MTPHADLVQALFDHVLSGDPRVIHAGHVECLLPFHAVPPHEKIADRFAEQMSHGERAGHVRGRDRDDEDVG
jgi:hypothetical protein